MICPSCHNDQSVTEHNYGALYTCKSCQAVYFINFEGQPEFGDMQSIQEQAPHETPQGFSMPTMAEPSSADFSFSLPSADESLHMSTLPPTNLPDAVAAVMDELPQTNEPAQEIDPMQPLVQFNQNEFAAEPNPFEKPSKPVSNQFSDVAKDISDYGNSETQIAHLNYDLKISGLDTAEVKSLLKEAIEDSRFGWDANEMMRTIKKGEIFFEKLNPAKAFILAKRLQFLDVEKVWKQNAVG
jgi:hypothetical protein